MISAKPSLSALRLTVSPAAIDVRVSPDKVGTMKLQPFRSQVEVPESFRLRITGGDDRGADAEEIRKIFGVDGVHFADAPHGFHQLLARDETVLGM